MSFWTGAQVNEANLERLGPAVQGFVGTEGAYTDLYDAMGDPGGPQWSRVVVLPGATLSTDLDISGVDYGLIMGAGLISLGGTAKLSLSNCNRWDISGLKFNSTVTANGAMALWGYGDGNNHVSNCFFNNSTVDGLHIQNYNVWVTECTFYSGTNDGIYIHGANTGAVWISRCAVIGNGGWGIDDQADLCHITDCKVTGNSSGQINSSSSYLDNNQVA